MTLGKGLNFIPTDKISRTNIMKDFKKFERKLRLKHFFHEYKTIPKTNHPFKEKSKFSVPIIGDNPIEQYIFHTKMELSNYKPNKTKNMTKEETQCLRTLRHIETITIHKADKNNITVVQNKKDYANEGERQLNDGIHYIEIPEINIKNTMNKINEIVYNMNKDNYLDEITFKYIKYENQYITTPFAYFLPKIHKLDNEILKDIYKQQTEIKIQVPARPIISQCNGPLERIGRPVKQGDGILFTSLFQENCFQHVSSVNVTQNLSKNETLFSVDTNAFLNINGKWTCQHGTYGDSASVTVNICRSYGKSINCRFNGPKSIILYKSVQILL
ncbi:unnamed protein product [Mytilus edulis]|uniref:Uncharacterized protein n=1 Tax=Mytilus edulis TaxID=6550 RepID=A0A8S3S260_MYTED|nr:unnamed protein product [Mytilus edulis]